MLITHNMSQLDEASPLNTPPRVLTPVILRSPPPPYAPPSPLPEYHSPSPPPLMGPHRYPVEEERMPEKEDYWQFLCAAIKMCVNNPQNFTNQYQTSLVIPKAITFLDNWFHQAFNKHFSEYVNILTGMLVSIIAGNPTNQLCFSIYSGIQTIVRGLNLLIEWSDAPLNISDVLEKLVILLDVALHDNYENCEQAALQGVIPLMLKMLPTFKEQQKFSLLMALTHLIGASSNNKKEFLKENGITTVVVATVNCKEDSRIGDAANMLIKLCADTALQQNEQKENSKISDFVLVNKQNNSRKPKSNENNIRANDHSRKHLDVSIVSNKQAQTDDITLCSCCFSSKNQDKIYSYCKLDRDPNGIKDKSYWTPSQHTNKTAGKLNLGDGIPERTCILSTPYKIAAESQAKENIVQNSGLNSSLFKRQDIKHLFPETMCESSHILEKRSENLMHRESLYNIANNNIKTKTSQNRNENIYHVMPTLEHNPKFFLQIDKNPSVFERYAVSYNPERNINMYIGTLPCQENNLQSDKQLHFVSGKTQTLSNTNNCCKSSQKSTVCQSNALQVNVPAPTKEHQITFEKIAMSHDMTHTKVHSVPQLFRNPDFQTNATLQTNIQQLKSKPKDISCKVNSKVTTFHDMEDNSEFYIKNKNQNFDPGISQISYSEQHFDESYLDLQHQNNIPNIRNGSYDKAANQNSYHYVRTSQCSHSKQHSENSNTEINVQKDTSDTNEETRHKKVNQNIHSKTSQFPNSQHVLNVHSKINEQNNTLNTREQYHYENINKNKHFLTSQDSGSIHSETNEQINSIRTNGDNHSTTANKNILPGILQFSYPKQHKGGINYEINKQNDTASSNEGSYNKKANQSIHPRTSQLQYCKHVQNTHSKTDMQKYTSNTKEESCNDNQNQSIHPKTSQLQYCKHVQNINLKTDKPNYRPTSNTKDKPCNENLNQSIHPRSSQLKYFKHVQNTHSKTDKQDSISNTKEEHCNENQNQSIHPRASQLQYCKHVQNTHSKADKQNNVANTKVEPCNENENQNVHPRGSQFPNFKHMYSTNPKVNKQHNRSTSSTGEQSNYENVKKNSHPVTSQFSRFEQHLESTLSETNKRTSSIRTSDGCHHRTENQNINPIKSQFSHPKRHLESINSQTNMQRNTINTREIQPTTHQCESQINQNNNFLKDISAHDNNNASVSKTINHNVTINPTNDKSEIHLNLKNGQHYYKVKSKTATNGNFKMSKHQIICGGDEPTCNGTNTGYITPSPNTHKNIDKMKTFYPYSNVPQKPSHDLIQSFDSIQSSQHSVSNFSSFTVTKKSDSSNKTECSTGNVNIFQRNKMLNSSLHLEGTHAMNEKNIIESDLWSNENKTNRIPTRSTLDYQQHSIEQKANKGVVQEMKYASIDVHNNSSANVSLSSSFSLEDKMFHKKQVSTPRHHMPFKRPMLKYTKMELDNLVAGVAKYGLDFKAIRRAYTFHRKRTSKDLYLKWRNSYINPRRYHVPVPGPQVQVSDLSTLSGLHKFE